MGLSNDFINSHIVAWEQRLKGPSYPHRARWPSFLFHHAPLENAVSILKSGRLLSRLGSSDIRQRDVAAAGVIDHSQRAHQFARLYFRPRTPTQFHIEGIRKVGECQFGENAHAPVLIMLAFDARLILSLENICFSDSNMQTGAIEQNTETFFQTIPFEKVYHEGALDGDRSIIAHRCAEVLALSPLTLEGKLKWIYCRSEAEKMTLLQALGDTATLWGKRTLVSDDLKVFEKRFAFVESASLANDGVIFRLNPRYDLKPVSILVEAKDAKGRVVLRSKSDQLAATPPKSPFWRSKASLSPGVYRVTITIDGHLAFDAFLALDDEPF